LVPDWLFVEQVNIWHIQSINESIDTCAKVELNELPEWGYFVRILCSYFTSESNYERIPIFDRLIFALLWTSAFLL
jgi:hypothetical protein